MKLTPETKSALLYLSEGEGLNAIFTVIKNLVGNMEKDVLNFDINEKSFANLAITKAKMDGAKLLEARLRSEIASLKGDKKNGREL